MIKTGDEVVDWKSFKACSDEKKVVWMENGQTNQIGTTSEKIWLDEENDILFRQQKLVFLDPNKRSRTIQLAIKHSTFEPLNCLDEGSMIVKLEYHTEYIDLEVTDGDNIRTMTIDKDHGAFDLFSLELLLRLLPLDIGYKAELEAFNHMVKATVPVQIEVTGIDKISDGIKEVDAWCIQLHFGENLQTYWISSKTKELLKQSVKLSEGVYFDFVR
ncbi:hypothetical protein ACFSO7_06990 [Bacillus sp. CGMCC 1.16607]|uniref:DUF3108 domain-containing protein n=1 Tax=Bacillus sp. CGMCC 1.16607 TaxID=3351842 RepID=UPI00362E55E4